jgi:hypothetical protein
VKLFAFDTVNRASQIGTKFETAFIEYVSERFKNPAENLMHFKFS